MSPLKTTAGDNDEDEEEDSLFTTVRDEGGEEWVGDMMVRVLVFD
jgi:hypothetical protein